VRYPIGSGPSWDSSTNGQGHSPRRLVLQDSGTAVLYDGLNNVIWSTVPNPTYTYESVLSEGRCGGCIDCNAGKYKDTFGTGACSNCSAFRRPSEGYVRISPGCNSGVSPDGVRYTGNVCVRAKESVDVT
jgi:hypothetical protein